MIAIFIAVGQSLVDSGLASSLIRTQDLKEEDYSTVFFINIIGSFIIYTCCFLAAPHIADFYKQPILTNLLRVYSIDFLIIALVIVQRTKLTKELNFKTQLKVQLPATIISGFVGISLAETGHGVWSLVYMYLVRQALTTCLFWYLADWRPRWLFNFERFKIHFNYGYKITLSGIIGVAMKNSYYIVIGKFFPPNLLGFYTRATQTKQLPLDLIGNTLNRVSFPLFTRMQDDPKKLKVAFKKLLSQIYFFLVPILMGAITLATPLFEFLFTAKWLPAVPLFQLLCIVGLYSPLHIYNLNILKVYGRSDLVLRLELFKQILVFINIFLAIQFGIYGLLIGQIFATNIAYFINTYYSSHFIDYGATSQIKDIIPIVLIGILSMSITYYLDSTFFFSYMNFIRLLLGTAIGGSLYLFIAVVAQIAAYQEFRQLLGRLPIPFFKSWSVS